MRHVCLLAALLLPLAALAQITLTSDSVVSSTTQQIHVGRSACSNNQLINFSWDLGAGHPALGETVSIVQARSSSTCNSTSVTAPDKSAAFSTSQEKNTSQVKAVDMILDQTDAGMPGGCSNTTTTSASPWTTHYCIQSQAALGGAVTSAELPVMFAMLNPKPPVNLRI